MGREEWLRQYLELPNGIPSWYTIERVLDVIDPKQFEKCFAEWMKEVTQFKEGDVVAIDGKTMCGTADKRNAKKAIHIVSAWCSSDKLVLGQVKTDEKILQYGTKEKGHGRIEECLYYYSTDIRCLDAKKDWTKLTGIGMVIRRVEVNGEKTEERVYHLGSVKTAEEYARGVRMHWGIESTHWSLDVTFREDASRTRKGCAPQNLALLKRMALNMVKKDQERYPKKSLKRKSFIASLREEYPEYIFSINFR